jgi:hypothetical protein
VYMGDYSLCVAEGLELAAVVAVTDVSGPSDVVTPDLDAGDYFVVWTQGAYKFNDAPEAWSAHGISLAYGGGNTGSLNPPTYSPDATAAETFYNSIIGSLGHDFTHTGGPMTLQVRDSYYGDNALGVNPPIFAIYLRRVGCPPTTTTTTTPTTTTTSTTTDEPRGACCVGGDCISNVTLAQCILLGGEYLNDGSTCEDAHTGNDHGVTIVCPTTTTSTTTDAWNPDPADCSFNNCPLPEVSLSYDGNSYALDDEAGTYYGPVVPDPGGLTFVLWLDCATGFWTLEVYDEAVLIGTQTKYNGSNTICQPEGNYSGGAVVS